MNGCTIKDARPPSMRPNTMSRDLAIRRGTIDDGVVASYFSYSTARYNATTCNGTVVLRDDQLAGCCAGRVLQCAAA